jgi:hypothetical protein
MLVDESVIAIVTRFHGGRQQAGDKEALIRLGWWNTDTKDFISLYLLNTCLSQVIPVEKNVVYLQQTKNYIENAETAIIAGLSEMIKSDFTCDVKSGGVRVEDSIAYNWAIQVKNKVPNAHLLFQERSRSRGRVDFYLNGFADCAIEVLLNANKSGSSQDIDEHLKISIST